MKFAKQLRQSQHAEWDVQYVDYKLLKQLLKQLEAPHAARTFCAQLELQINKVADFMRQQQDCLADDIEPLFRGERTALVSYPSACEEVVDNIQRFRSFTELNQEALRKIIKKFDKRFNLRFHDEVYPAAAPVMPCTEKDVVSWLLSPASRCLRLVRSFSSQEVAQPIQQFNFWATELAIGCDLLRHRFDDVDAQTDAYTLSSLRLRLGGIGPENLRMCIKNTFIHSGGAEGVGPSGSASPLAGSLVRRKSLPADFSAATAPDSPAGSYSKPQSNSTAEAPSSGFDDEDEEPESWGNTPVVMLEHVLCDELQLAPVPRDWGSMEDFADEQDMWVAPYSSTSSFGDRRSGGQREKRVQGGGKNSQGGGRGRGARGEIAGGGSWGSGVDWKEEPHHSQYFQSSHSPHWRGDSRDTYGAVGPRSGATGALAAGPQDGSCHAPQMMEGHGARWWTESPGECPLSGFPVSMLPHPPFRFRAEPNSSGRYRLVDGQYLALDVLATWRFEALGRQLTIKDINALDAYIKRCKLGPWRLGEAMSLFSDGSSDAHNKLEALRRSARRKLEDLRRIQQRRKLQVSTSGSVPK
mmetsp:Transcript_31276/g.57251  ORF Transcript_31276/g.57251 Transcript_31276/m.57251 type:complete len:582 (+) Transcript_31276:168-1913(+)